MNKQTKTIIGVLGIGLIGYLIYMNKKPSTTTTPTPSPSNNGGEDKGCPEGTKEVVVNCFKAPCPKECQDKDGNAIIPKNNSGYEYYQNNNN